MDCTVLRHEREILQRRRCRDNPVEGVPRPLHGGCLPDDIDQRGLRDLQADLRPEVVEHEATALPDLLEFKEVLELELDNG